MQEKWHVIGTAMFSERSAALANERNRLTVWLSTHPDAPADQRAAARVVRDNVADLLRLDNPSGRARTLAAMAVAEMIFEFNQRAA